jgi:uncharacterized membrane protein YedE/YeeE
MEEIILRPLLGGVLIGLAATLMLLFNGRVTGISGILGGFLSFERKNTFWRFAFLAGLLLGGLLLRVLSPAVFENSVVRGSGVILLAGFLVGFGTLMGGGCTSGHGVCGISRLSIRSVVATLTFMALGFITVALTRWVLGAV